MKTGVTTFTKPAMGPEKTRGSQAPHRNHQTHHHQVRQREGSAGPNGAGRAGATAGYRSEVRQQAGVRPLRLPATLQLRPLLH